jgi:hypothetical protein
MVKKQFKIISRPVAVKRDAGSPRAKSARRFPNENKVGMNGTVF